MLREGAPCLSAPTEAGPARRAAGWVQWDPEGAGSGAPQQESSVLSHYGSVRFLAVCPSCSPWPVAAPRSTAHYPVSVCPSSAVSCYSFALTLSLTP